MLKQDINIDAPLSEWSKDELINAVTYNRCSHKAEIHHKILSELHKRNLTESELNSIKEYEEKLNDLNGYESNSAIIKSKFPCSFIKRLWKRRKN